MEISRCETGGFNDPFEESLTLQEMDQKLLAEMSFAESLRQIKSKDSGNKGLLRTFQANNNDLHVVRKIASFITGRGLLL